MCGICAVIDFDCVDHPHLKELVALVGRRGPDSLQTLSISAEDSSIKLEITSSVLSLRGESLSAQPATTSADVFCWNGEAWRIGDQDIEGSDTPMILEKLKSSTEDTSREARALHFARTLSTIKGPYAFFYYSQANGLVFFGRDPLGRRSQLYCFQSPSSLIVSSVASKSESSEWIESEPGLLYVINLGGIDTNPTFQNFATGSTINRRYLTLKYFQTMSKRADDYLEFSDYAYTSSPVVEKLQLELTKSLRYRVQNINTSSSNVINGPKLAVLFSGGLDCSLLAVLIDKILPTSEEIDLLNVAFQNPRVEASLRKSKDETDFDIYSHCPDRITARAAYNELCNLSERKWNLVEINVSYAEYLANKQTVIDLMYPHRTEMDLSIASAFYFAARGKGILQSDDYKQRREYSTPARVLLSGLGADELFGGYTRHIATYQRAGDAAVLEELELEIERLPHRNLGRDDRVISHWGREARYPFLDELFVGFARSLSVKTRCGFGMKSIPKEEDPVTEPGKRLLRLLAWNLGLRGPAGEKKRAIQFGARTAKMEAGKTKGHHEIS